MTFKKIVVPVTGSESDHAALFAAFAAARPFAGHVQALFVLPDPRDAVPFIGLPVSPEVVQQIIESAETIVRTARSHAEINVKRAAEEAGIAFVAAPLAGRDVTCSLREVQGGFLSHIRDASRLCDLAVFGPNMPDGGPDVSGAFIDTLTTSQRPVLLAPQQPADNLTDKIVVGWDGSTAAARALMASVPLLGCAAIVELCFVGPVPEDSAQLDEPIAYLALHGITASSRIVDPAGAPAGPVLLSEAEQAGATLLVLGGYGHSRLIETLFGGTTVHIAAHATLPLFMLH